MLQWHSMRALVLSDVHSNLVALEAVLAQAPAYEQVWCLGDLVGYGPQPNECISRLRELPLTCLAGNHDRAVVGQLDTADFNADAARAITWTHRVLTPENHDYLSRLSDRLDVPDQGFTLVHGSPRSPLLEYMLSTWTAAENMQFFDTPVCLFGHTHVPVIFAEQPGTRRVSADGLPESEAVRLEPKLLINPGSVGQPRDGDPRAAYALVDLETRELRHYRVEYRIAETQAAMEKVRLPSRLIRRLEFGR